MIYLRVARLKGLDFKPPALARYRLVSASGRRYPRGDGGLTCTPSYGVARSNPLPFRSKATLLNIELRSLISNRICVKVDMSIIYAISEIWSTAS
ncbi:hypothetical protein EVAR_69835_1 [Eumeta japonica]|uniref:Uncharacterized protein n=1 Tax=Eumeta variegata TaxID=151549 RepID=A0A4C1ZW66_EUMVA|nr:hypothetical protein EVAR_69835_1 [Eumeta japonica]